MRLIKFKLPEQRPADKAFEQQLQEYLEWLENAPLLNAVETGEQITRFLASSNLVLLDRVERLRLLDRTLNSASNVCAVLEERRLSVRAIVNKQFVRSLEVEGALLDALVTGYKQVVSEGLSESVPLADSTMRTALVKAAHLSVTRLTNIFAGYQREPKGLWFELHQLFEISNELGGVTIPRPQGNEDASTLKACIGYSVDVSYKAALLLAMFDPNRLMEGEADAVFRTLLDWSEQCRLIPVSGGVCTKGSFIVDTDLDTGPHFVASTATAAPEHGLQVDASEVIKLIESRIGNIIAQFENQAQTQAIPFQTRVERDLLHRLCVSLKGRRERRHERKQIEDTIELVAGFNTAHHRLRGGAPFTPELDEFAIHHIDYTQPQEQKPQLSLVPLELESWGSETKQELDKLSRSGDRSSRFNPDDSSLDVWSSIYAAPLRAPGDEKLNPVTHWQVINRSASGLALRTTDLDETGVRVGGLIVFKSRSRTGEEHWYLATVRWMSRENGVCMGLRVLAVDLQPVALRAIEGVGAGCEYLRGFFVPGRGDGKSPAHLFTPPAIFDRHTLLAINDSHQLYYAHLERMNETTRLYSLFDVCIKPMPESEAQRVEQLKKVYMATKGYS